MIGAAVVILAGFGFLALSDRSSEAPESASAEDGQPLVAAETRPGRATPPRIPENGRLSVSLEDLPDGDGLVLELGMPDEARGEGSRQVRLVDVERERMMETTGAPVSGTGTGLQIEIEPGWLLPGSYLIEVDTAEKKPLALRRYVLELQ